jgi:hypothetical protein
LAEAQRREEAMKSRILLTGIMLAALATPAAGDVGS